METIGDRVRALREEHKWSMNELARRSGVDAGLISKLERATRPRPAATTVTKLARTLGVTERELHDGRVETYCGETDPWVIKRLRSMHVDQLPTEAQESVIRFVRHVKMMVAEEQAEYQADCCDGPDDAPDDRAIAG